MLKIYKDNKWIQSVAHNITNPFKSLPDFLIVGAQKAGTTSCYLYLREHPQIQMYCPKEVQFFSFNYHKGKNWYTSHAPLSSVIKQNTLLGEASPYYLLHPHTPRRIHELIPSVKLIVLLRNPTTRAISHYYHN